MPPKEIGYDIRAENSIIEAQWAKGLHKDAMARLQHYMIGLLVSLQHDLADCDRCILQGGRGNYFLSCVTVRTIKISRRWLRWYPCRCWLSCLLRLGLLVIRLIDSMTHFCHTLFFLLSLSRLPKHMQLHSTDSDWPICMRASSFFSSEPIIFFRFISDSLVWCHTMLLVSCPDALIPALDMDLPCT